MTSTELCDGLVGMVSASSGGLTDDLICEVFATSTSVLGAGGFIRDDHRQTVVAVRGRLVAEGRIAIVRLANDSDRDRWCTPEQASSHRAAGDLAGEPLGTAS